ncbi:hypothetical protein [Massilia niastensis]|uniref:hypothetical protein n=1 Tax=Massilia niastensis TaxID=544911 RepID=UPI00035FF604|nr:hypothetical protein [Massilia niastensis]
MDRTRNIERLAAVLADAGGRADWDLLEKAVRELAPRLQALAAHGPWSAAERAALQRLRTAHEGAAAACAAGAALLQARLDELCNNKEGWMAYALAGELESGDTPR